MTCRNARALDGEHMVGHYLDVDEYDRRCSWLGLFFVGFSIGVSGHMLAAGGDLLETMLLVSALVGIMPGTGTRMNWIAGSRNPRNS